jgi:hypothetical protein
VYAPLRLSESCWQCEGHSVSTALRFALPDGEEKIYEKEKAEQFAWIAYRNYSLLTSIALVIYVHAFNETGE